MFVCSHDFGCCLSSGGMYTCSSQTLVHLFSSQVLLVGHHASVLSLILNRGSISFGFFFFHSLVSIDSLEPVCVFSLSWRWFVHALLSLWVVDRRSRGSFAPPPTPPCLGLGSWCFVTTLTNSVGLSSLCAVVATHFDLVCCCFFSVFFWKLQFSFFRRAAGTTKGIFA